MKAAVGTVYFGKLPSRGDFVRSAQQPALTQSLDRWVSGALEQMSTDVRWKEVYDTAPALHFAVLGSAGRSAMAGHLVASSDHSGRRFPFIAAGTFEVEQPLAFMARSPMALTRLWNQYERLARRALTDADAVPVLGELNALQAEVVVDPAAYDAGYGDFLEMQTVGSLQSALAAAHPQVDVRLSLLGLGLLLQPVPASGINSLEKGVRLPLPGDPLYGPLFAAWWIDLASRFLSRADFEVVLFMPQGERAGPASLSIGFAGGSPAALHAMLDARAGADMFVDLLAPAWAGEQADQDWALAKLDSYLGQEGLSLRQLAASFGETFLGE